MFAVLLFTFILLLYTYCYITQLHLLTLGNTTTHKQNNNTTKNNNINNNNKQTKTATIFKTNRKLMFLSS